MNFDFDSKTKLIAIGFFIAFVTLVSVLYGTTDLFKGFVSDETSGVVNTEGNVNQVTPATLSSKLENLNTGIAEVQILFDEVITLSESSGADGYENYDVIIPRLAEHSESLDSIETDAAAFDTSTFETLSEEEKSQTSDVLSAMVDEVNSIKTDLENLTDEFTDFLSTVVLCPIDEGESNAVTFQTNYETFVALIQTFNDKDYFEASDVEDLKNFSVVITTTNNATSETGCLDFSAHTPTDVEEETQIINDFLDDKTVNEIITFANAAISTFNTSVVNCYIENGCTTLGTINTNINSKPFCEEGEIFNAETAICSGSVCPSEESLSKLDDIYTILGNYAETPDEFDDESFVLLQLAITGFDEAFETILTAEDFAESFDYRTGANSLIDNLNTYIESNSNELCTSVTPYEYLVITGNGDNSSNPTNNQGSLSCPAEAIEIPELGACVCPNERVIPPGQDCNESTDNNSNTQSGNTGNTNQNQSTQPVVCNDGTVVLDISECPVDTGQSTTPQESGNEETILGQNGSSQTPQTEVSLQNSQNNGLHGSQIEVPQNGFDLGSNTQADVLNSPVIQGETGAEAIAILAVLVIAVFNLFVWVK